ncbi:MAG: ATP-dependent Clp protease ATP-binding subunit, partial [bacterium]|nr:ATP-dependent Clp protease ATP-binding subunit [bacterium]
LNFESAKTVQAALKSDCPEISSTHLLYYLILQNPKFNFIFNRLLLDRKEFLISLAEDLKKRPKLTGGGSLLAKDLENTLEKALEISMLKNHKKIESGDILSSLAKEDRFFKDIMINGGIKTEDIENLSCWIDDLELKFEKRKRFWDRENLAKRGTLAKAWTAGYTITLDRYGIDLTQAVKNTEMEFVGHREELESVERILSVKGINNVLLIGQPGTGKKSIVYHLAKNSLSGHGMKDVNYKRVVELDLPSLLAQIESSEEVEVVLDKIFREATSAGNIILVIDNIHNYIGQHQIPGIVDISGLLGPYLRFSDFRMIGITTYEGLHKNIERNSSILSLFEKVEVKEISLRETLQILEYQSLILEEQYGIFISYPALREIVALADRYFPSLAFPEKAIDLLKESVVYISGLRDSGKALLPAHIAKIVSQKTEIPVGEIEDKEKDILLNLEGLIHQRIINQEEAVKEVSTALRRARSEITVRQGPMGTFLFLGPTGVGKTETSKALAQIYFGSEQKMIRLDMSEFQSANDIPRLIGSSAEQGLLTEPARENPFSLILLDEIEKAHANILNVFLQVFDEGHVTDGLGRKVNFKNTIIIATSNAGSDMIIKALKKNEKWEGVRQRMTDYLFEERVFRPELLNRFDAIVLFTPLSKKNLVDISEILLKKLKKNLLNKGIEFEITEDLKEKIAELGYNPVFGARYMRRVIQEKVENVLAEALLSGKIIRGSKIEIDKNFNLRTK